MVGYQVRADLLKAESHNKEPKVGIPALLTRILPHGALRTVRQGSGALNRAPPPRGGPTDGPGGARGSRLGLSPDALCSSPRRLRASARRTLGEWARVTTPPP